MSENTMIAIIAVVAVLAVFGTAVSRHWSEAPCADPSAFHDSNMQSGD